MPRNSDVARWFRCPLSLRSVVVNALEPVAGTTLRPRAANSPLSDDAMTLLPLPGPPWTTTTVL